VLHFGLIAMAAIVVPRASARVRDVIAVELVAVEPPPHVVDAPPTPPAPPKRVTLPKPIATPLPKLDARREPPTREPEPAPVPQVRAPEPAALPASPPVASTPSPPAVSPPRSSTPTTGRALDSGVSLVESRPAPPAVASIPRESGVTRVARPTGGYQVRPSYPSSARRLGVQGTTLLRVHVLEDGRVGDVDVEQTAGHPDLDQAAADAVRRWRFEPARRGEQAVAMWVRLPVEFRLK
jgi:protein TonB